MIRQVFGSNNKYCHQSIFVLFSSIFLLIIPLGYILLYLREENILILLISLGGILSILADYCIIENELINILDRIVGTILVLSVIQRCYRINNTKIIIITILTIILIKYSRSSQSKGDWVRRHCIWHLGCIIFLLYCFNMLNNVK